MILNLSVSITKLGLVSFSDMSSNSGWNCLLLLDVVTVAVRIVAVRFVVVSGVRSELAFLYGGDTAAERLRLPALYGGDTAAE